MGTYRWDKRRTDKRRRKRYSSIPVFDAVLVFLIFCLGLLLFRILSLYALTTNYCFEQIANFGATTTTLPVFKALYFISLILLALWGVLLIADIRRRPSWLRFLWDAITGLSIVIMCGLYFHLNAWDNPNPPDGTLGIGEGVWTTESGTPEWRKLPPMQIPLERTGGAVEYFKNYRLQKCVWLDDNKISVTLSHSQTTEDFDDYVKKLQEGGLHQDYAFTDYPDKMKLRDFVRTFFSPTSHMETLIASQYTRPLTTEERARFMEKRACIKLAYDPTYDLGNPGYQTREQVEKQCDPTEVPYWPPGYW